MFCETADTDVDKWNEMHTFMSIFHDFINSMIIDEGIILFFSEVFHCIKGELCSRQLINLDVSNFEFWILNFEYFFWFILLWLPVENKNIYLTFKIQHLQINELPRTFFKNTCLQKKYVLEHMNNN